MKDLREDLEVDISRLSYGPTSAPAVWRDTVILGFSCDEGPGPSAPGDIRAFDVRTGMQKWRFHTVPRPGEFGNETWEGDSWKNRGGANAWGGLSVRREREARFSLGSDPRRLIFTVAIEKEITFSQIVPLQLMRNGAAAVGTFKRCTMTCGITICPSIRILLLLHAMARKSMRSPKSRKLAMCSCLTAERNPVVRSSRDTGSRIGCSGRTSVADATEYQSNRLRSHNNE